MEPFTTASSYGKKKLCKKNLLLWLVSAVFLPAVRRFTLLTRFPSTIFPYVLIFAENPIFKYFFRVKILSVYYSPEFSTQTNENKGRFHSLITYLIMA